MKPSSRPELAGRDPAVRERHRRLGEAAAGRDHLVEQVLLELPDERGERRGVGPHPARAIDDPGPLDDARQLRPEGARQAPARSGPSPRRRPARRHGARRRQRARAPAPGVRSRIARRPASRPGPHARVRSIRRPTTVAAAPSAEPMRIPACHARSSRQDGRALVAASSREHPELDGFHVREVGPEQPTGQRPEALGVTGRQLAMGRRARRRWPPPARSRSAARPGPRRWPWPNRRWPRRSPTMPAMIGPQQRVVGAAEQQRVDRRAGRAREDRLAVGIALAEQGRQARRHGRLRGRPGQLARLDHRHEVGRGVLVDLDGRVLVLDRVEVGVRADRGRRRDDPDPPVAGRQCRRRGARAG